MEDMNELLRRANLDNTTDQRSLELKKTLQKFNTLQRDLDEISHIVKRVPE